MLKTKKVNETVVLNSNVLEKCRFVVKKPINIFK